MDDQESYEHIAKQVDVQQIAFLGRDGENADGNHWQPVERQEHDCRPLGRSRKLALIPAADVKGGNDGRERNDQARYQPGQGSRASERPPVPFICRRAEPSQRGDQVIADKGKNRFARCVPGADTRCPQHPIQPQQRDRSKGAQQQREE